MFFLNFYNPYYWYNVLNLSTMQNTEEGLSNNVEEDPQDFDIEVEYTE